MIVLSYWKTRWAELYPAEAAIATVYALKSKVPHCIFYDQNDRQTCHDHWDTTKTKTPTVTTHVITRSAHSVTFFTDHKTNVLPIEPPDLNATGGNTVQSSVDLKYCTLADMVLVIAGMRMQNIIKAYSPKSRRRGHKHHKDLEPFL